LIGGVTLVESSPAPAVADVLVVTTEYFTTPAGGAAFHTTSDTINAAASAAVPAGSEAATLTADNAWITSTLIPHMQRPGAPPHQLGVARLLTAVPPRLHLESMIIRSDSAAEVGRRRGNPAVEAAWYLGNTGRTSLFGLSAGGVRDPSFPDHVFVNRTMNLVTGATRGLDTLADSAAHEGVHAADIGLNTGDWGEYQREFRAYWIEDAVGRGLPTGQMASAPAIGPRSEKANAIFRHLYGNPTYPYVKPAYDGNVDGFREKADAYFHPDGVNLSMSVALFDLQREVEDYNGTGFAAKRAAIHTKFAACSPAEKDEVRTQNQWSRMVDAKYTNAAEHTAVRTELAIP
jgi:hypothetical protein